MLENRIRDNGNQYYKFATITVRVFVDKNDVENMEDFDKIADGKIRDMFKRDEPCKLCDISLA